MIGNDPKSKATIGGLNDYISAPYVFGENPLLAHANTLYYHIHGKPFVYPNHADEVLLTAGVGAWDLTGALTEIIPSGVLNESAFDLHWLNISSISANGTIQIDLYAGEIGEEILIPGAKATRTTVTNPEGARRIQIPQQAAGTRISARLSDSTAGSLTCLVSLAGHYYKGL